MRPWQLLPVLSLYKYNCYTSHLHSKGYNEFSISDIPDHFWQIYKNHFWITRVPSWIGKVSMFQPSMNPMIQKNPQRSLGNAITITLLLQDSRILEVLSLQTGAKALLTQLCACGAGSGQHPPAHSMRPPSNSPRQSRKIQSPWTVLPRVYNKFTLPQRA